MKPYRFLLFLLFLLMPRWEVRAEPSLADATIVIYNTTVPDSVKLAKFYAQQRGIPNDHLIGLVCSTEEEITREEFDKNIAGPLRDIFKDRKWWTLRESEEGRTVTGSTIKFAAVIKGIPLKIHSTPDPGDVQGPAPIGNRNEASVDSELAVLAAKPGHISGITTNPYFKSFRAVGEIESLTLLLVCRLDAPTAATVKQMITDTIAAEKNGLWGRAYVDSANNTGEGLAMGDQWLGEITKQLRKSGVPVVYDEKSEIFPESFPVTDCALYYGWYTSDIAGPFGRAEFRFVPGAIAVHIHSFSASTLRDAKMGWAGPLVTKGAAVTLGYVYEPYLQLTAQLDIFNDRLLHGFTLGESAYMSLRALSWMSVVIGDPLYRPYSAWLQISSQRDSARTASWRMYHDFALKNAGVPPLQYRVTARQAAAGAHNAPMMEDIGVMEARDGNFPSATNNLQMARTYYTTRDDIVRVVLEEADAWIKQKKPKRALELIRTTMRKSPDTPAAPLLRALEREASGKPPIPKALPNKP